MNVDTEFLPALAGFELEELDRAGSSVYAFDETFRIRFVNEAWVRFCRENDGDPVRCGLGANVLEVIPESLVDFYRPRFLAALAGEAWDSLYECSSPHEFRSFRMLVYPLKGSVRGGLVVNAQVAREPHDREALEAGPDYLSDAGLVLMCCCCRRVRNQTKEAQWDWVPSLLTRSAHPVSHGLCYPCLVHYYSD